MSRLLRRRPSFLLRLLMLAVVAFGTIGGTTASALGELHELAHLDHPSTPHEDRGIDSGHDPGDAGERLLHALLHCGHCHGQGGLLPFAAPAWEVPAAPSATPSSFIDTGWPAAPLESLLRPPIQA